MGNSNRPSITMSDMTPSALSSLEYKTGGLLLSAIREGDLEALRAAIETARREYVAEHAMTLGGDAYESMVVTIISYLSRSYITDDGTFLFGKTPIEYANSKNLPLLAEYIQKTINELGKAKMSSISDVGVDGSARKDLGYSERVAEAKAKLKAFHDQKLVPKKK
jgi:hypothetical protein